MSQQSLASKKITKRNVAQSSVIFSVVVAVVTLGVIASVAYVDITENNDSASLEKSIPELIAEQKLRLEENHRQVELLSQAEDLVLTMDKRVEDLKQLDEKVKKVNEQLSFIATNLKATEQTAVKPKSSINTVNSVKSAQQQSPNQVIAYQTNYKPPKSNVSLSENKLFINSVFNQNNAAQMSATQQVNAGGEGYLEFSWLFKGRGRMSMSQREHWQSYLKSQSAWNAKIL